MAMDTPEDKKSHLVICLQHGLVYINVRSWIDALLLKICAIPLILQKWNAYVRLNLKLNCHVDVPGGYSPCSFINVRPSWMIFNKSTLHRSSLVLVISIASKFTDWSCNYTWKLCVLQMQQHASWLLWIFVY